MKFYYRLPAVLIGAAVLLVPPQLALSLTQTEVDKIAKEITVRIDGDGSGSGWIYEHKGDIYYVVTNHHVVAKDNGKYKIRTVDGDSYDAVERPLGQSNLDLTVLQFTSKKVYKVANLGNSDQIKEKMTVYAVGWAESLGNINLQEKKTVYAVSQTESASNTHERGYEFQPGNILNHLQNPIGDGYALMYDNQVDPGMSGGPLLDVNGRVVGINGLGFEWQTGYVRLGIPINTFLAARNNLQPLTPSSPTITKQPNSGGTTTRQQSAESLISLGGAKADKGDYQGAIANYNQALQISPNNPDIYYQRGAAYFNLNNRKAALDDFNQVVRLNPKNYRPYLYRGLLYNYQKDYKRAIEDFNTAISLNPNISNGYLNRGGVRYRQGNKQAALQDFNQVTRMDTKSSAAWNNQGAVLENLGRNEEALASFDRAIQLNNAWGTGSLAYAYSNRGNVRYRQGNKQAALQDYNQATRIDPKLSATWEAQGNVLADLGKNEEAIASFDRAIQVNNDWGTSSLADAYVSRGNIRYKQGNKQAALQDYNQASRINPKSSQLWLFQGFALADLGENKEAIAAYDRAIQLNNDWGERSLADAYVSRGDVRNQQGNKQAAIADFNDAIRIAPNNALGYQLRGLSYHYQGDYNKAIVAYKKAITQDAKSINPVNNIGLIKYELGDVEGAIRQFQAAIAINNQSAEPQLAQAVALYNKGDQERGLAMAEAALRLDNRFADVEFLKKNLWGDHLIADTRKLLQNPRIRSISSHGK